MQLTEGGLTLRDVAANLPRKEFNIYGGQISYIVFLFSHLQNRSSNDLFQEMINTKELDKETMQQFVYRIMGLKQKVLWSSQQVDAVIVYAKNLSFSSHIIPGVK